MMDFTTVLIMSVSLLMATWLYACKIDFFSPLVRLKWGPSDAKVRIDPGYHSKQEASAARARADYEPSKRLSAQERLATPLEFAELLIALASTRQIKEMNK